MTMDRIIGVFTFRKDVYAEVERDTTFTTTAWILVAVISFLNQLGSRVSDNLIHWAIGAIIGTILTILGFAVAIYIINWVGRTVFNADVTFDELVRTLGLAYVWNIVGVLGALVAFSKLLSCLTAPALVIAAILGLVAWFLAAKEALDLDWAQTIVTVFIGWAVMMAITLFTGVVLTILGLGTAAAVRGIFGP
jgi:hypothetical protein